MGPTKVPQRADNGAENQGLGEENPLAQLLQPEVCQQGDSAEEPSGRLVLAENFLHPSPPVVYEHIWMLSLIFLFVGWFLFWDARNQTRVCHV